MAKLFLIFLLSCFCFIHAFPQKNFLPGYIVTLPGDTVRGFIDYQNWETNPKRIAFKEIDGRVTRYGPIQIKGFAVADEKYVGAVINSEDVANVSLYNPNIIAKTDTTFLQTMVSGPKSLYSYVPANGRELFYMGTDSVPALLVYKPYFKSVNGLDVQVENKRYIGQLTVYLADCPSVQHSLQRQEYQKKKLEKLFLEYYKECKSSEIKFHRKTESIRARLEFFLGASSTSLKLSGGDGNFDGLTSTKFSNSFNTTGGVAVDLLMQRNNQKWLFRNEFQITSFTCSGSGKSVNPYGLGYVLSNNTIGFNQLKINNLIRYNLRAKGVAPFINLGISNAFTLGYTNNTTLQGPRAYQQGLLAGGGLSVDIFSFELRYEGDYFGIVDSNIRSTITRFYALIGIRIPNQKPKS